MGCDASSWLCARAPVGYAGHRPGWFKQQPISSFCSKPPTVSCCSAIGPVDSSFSSSTSSVRSYGHRKTFDEASPDITRHWIEADQPLASHGSERFKVVSYNILGDKNATKHRDLYQNVPSLYLNWDRRKRVICEELIGWDPDIICLQEVDKYFDLSVIMGKAGYTGSYKRRTGDAADGCAMFWKADKFRLLEGESIEFKVFGLRDNVAQLSVFEMCKAESRRLLISNIHVLYYPSRGDVKLGQIRFLSSRAQILSEKWGNIPVVLTGDFNSTPQSALYKFLSLSQLNIMLYDRRELSGQRSCHPAQVFGVKRETGYPLILMDRYIFRSDNRLLNNCWTKEEIKVATGNSECHLVVHPLKLNSAYATVKGSSRTRDSNGEPLATSYHSKFLGTVDYLWYSDGLVPTRVLDTLPMDILRRTGGLPCKKLGSDHLALVSEFTFTQGAKEGNNTAKSTTSDIVIPAYREGINLLA